MSCFLGVQLRRSVRRVEPVCAARMSSVRASGRWDLSATALTRQWRHTTRLQLYAAARSACKCSSCCCSLAYVLPHALTVHHFLCVQHELLVLRHSQYLQRPNSLSALRAWALWLMFSV